uniref:Uncharacterized protein n=1 Tax=Anguilla anguilla TaxID=7936 RepID=A0A0E9SCY7_ANGAN
MLFYSALSLAEREEGEVWLGGGD